MVWVILFIFGLAIGSFLNVVALRYDGEHFLFDSTMIGGRSHCPHCGKTLRWFELLPVLSFVIQGAKCRHCPARIGIQYPLVELLAGCIFVAVPLRLVSLFPAIGFSFWLLSSLWIVVFLLLLLISYIDIRLGIIPDETHIMLGVVAVAIVSLFFLYGGTANFSFLGMYASLLGFQQNIWTNRIVGLLFGFIFFGLLVGVTRGKGMGMGDVKFALPLGFLLGWPDMPLATFSAFIVGALVGVLGIALKKKTMRATLPFAPFLATGVVFVFFFGAALTQWYFKMLGF